MIGMVIGKEIRLNRILKEGKMLCIPMDHGISNGPVRGLESPHSLIYECERAGLTCVLVNKGIIKTMPRPIGIGLIAHMSASTSIGSSPNKKVLMGRVTESIRLGADAVSVHINIGAKEEPDMLYDLGVVSDECTEWNVPLIAMMYPRGESIKNSHDVEVVAHAARIGGEAGADIVKTVYTGDINSFRKVTKASPVPVVIAGGPKVNTDYELLEMCEAAMKAGAKGVTFGRNIFQHENPVSIVRALHKVVIDGLNHEDAIEVLRSAQE
jgi:fructose-bisphosphate aldolase/2-amino-3,7-dideoxy-D-threo-hept-6-ulosonate synthase